MSTLADVFDLMYGDAGTEDHVNYKVELARSLGEPIVAVSFFGFVDEEHAESFAKYMMAFLELNKAESPSGLTH